MARRAASALTAIFALVAVFSLALLLMSAPPPAVAATSGIPATVTFTGLNPQWASPGTTISVAGSVKNTSGATRRLAVQLFDYSAPITSVADLQQSAAANSANGRSPIPLPNATWQSPLLRPGAAAT